MSESDEKYMQMALRLARRGIGSVEPNPVVGAILVKANQIIGRGWHKKFGGPHAEINALADCEKLAIDPKAAEMYVTLEPCCHKGKTAPCTDAIIAAKLSKVVVATIDPSEHAKGKGIEQLRNAGIKVQAGVCEAEARLLNAPFIKYAATGNCWTTLKWAQTIDGKLSFAAGNGKRWISGEQSRRDVHKLRRCFQAVLVGINTVIADNPLLTARPGGNIKAVRIVLDSHLRIPLKCKLLATAKKTPVLILTSQAALQEKAQIAGEINKKGAEVVAYPDMHGRSNLHFLFDELKKRGIARLFVEGGPTVIASFLREKLVDDIFVYIAPKLLCGSGSVDISTSIGALNEAIGLHHVEIKSFGDDVRISGLSEKAANSLVANTV